MSFDRKPVMEPRKPSAAPVRQVLPPIKRRPELSVLQIPPDPIDQSKYPGDIEGDAVEELSQVQAACTARESGFRERMKADASRKAAATDGGYFFTVVFESTEQASALLSALGLRPDGLFIDGRALADRLRIPLPEARVPYNPGGTASPKIAALVRKP